MELSPVFREFLQSCGNLQAAWEKCDRPDWMMVLLRLSHRNDYQCWKMITSMAIRRSAIRHIPNELIADYVYGYFGPASFLAKCMMYLQDREAALLVTSRAAMTVASAEIEAVADMAFKEDAPVKEVIVKALDDARLSSVQAHAKGEEHACLHAGLWALMPFVTAEATEADAAQAWLAYLDQALMEPCEKQRAEKDMVEYMRSIVPNLLEQPCQSAAGY